MRKVTKWFDKLFVLLWKEMMMRIRSPISLLLEATTHVLAYSLFYYLQGQIYSMETRDGSQSTNLMRNLIPRISDITTQPELFDMSDVRSIYYSPPSMKPLMIEVAKKIHLKQNDVHAFHDELDILAYKYKELTEDKSKYAVIFNTKNMSLDDLTQLKYKIRNRRHYRMDTIQSPTRDADPHEQYGAVYESFVALQMAIDHSFMQLKSGEPVSKSVSLQMYPYITKVETDPVTAVMYSNLYPSLSVNSILLYAALLASRLCRDKTTGIKALVKTADVGSGLMYVASIMSAIIVASPGLLFGSYLISVTDERKPYPFPSTNLGILFITYFLHITQASCVAAVCAAALPKLHIATSATVAVLIAFYQTLVQISDGQVRGFFTWLPNGSIIWFFEVTGYMHTRGKDVGWNNMFETIPGESGILAIWLTTIGSLLPLILIIWYCDHVLPGPYGVPDRWNFFLTKSYWFNLDQNSSTTPIDENPVEQFIEPETVLPIGIQIKNLWKVYQDPNKRKYAAVAGVNLNFYDKEITVLLGENGAGKTTLMSMMIGALKATHGKINFIEGAYDDVTLERESASPQGLQRFKRPRIGYCPQQNALISNLTCNDHLYFFAKLHYGIFHNVTSIVDYASEAVKLSGPKGSARAGVISGGEKRRLQLGIAIASGAHTLVLDEPTSGLDPRVRRELWDILLSLRGSHTVLVTTHYMDEADAIADRIAVMRLGHLICFGTPMYLKRTFGTGYRLTILTLPECDISALEKKVKDAISNADITSRTKEQVIFKLPSDKSSAFPTLFNDLEKDKESLCITTIGIGITTLEEIFLKVTQNEDVKSPIKGPLDTEIPVESQELRNLKGFSLVYNRIKAMTKKRLCYSRSTVGTITIVQIVMPFLIAVAAITLANLQVTTSDTNSNTLNAFIYPHMKSIYYSEINSGHQTLIEDLLKSTGSGQSSIKPVKTKNVTQELLSLYDKEVNTYTDDSMFSIEFEEKNYNVLFSTSVHHTLPVAVNFIDNILAYEEIKRVSPDEDLKFPIFVVDNEPIQGVQIKTTPGVTTKGPGDIFVWAFLMSFALYIHVLPLGTLPVQERGKVRTLIRMCGVPVYFHWLFNWLWDWIFYIIIGLFVVLITYLLEEEDMLNTSSFLEALFLLCLCHAMAALSFLYTLSFIVDSTAAITIVYLGLCIVFGPILTVVLFGLFMVEREDLPIAYFLEIISYLTPPYPFSRGLTNIGYIALQNDICVQNYQLIQLACTLDITGNNGHFHLLDCCAAKVDDDGTIHGPYSYISGDHGIGVGGLLLVLVSQAIVFMGIVLFLDSVPNGTFWSWIGRCFPKSVRKPDKDDTVTIEREYVNSLVETNGGKLKHLESQQEHSLIVSDMFKSYFVYFKEPVQAVRGVSFATRRGECFGLLGVNGSGKTSLMTMLVKLNAPTSGLGWVNGDNLKSDPNKYLSHLGYCPQFEALSYYLTGAQQITLLLQMQGIHPEKVPYEVNRWINCLGLQQNKDKLTGKYSGGQKRRLSSACALLLATRSEETGQRGIALLDEPTSGVDPAATRQLWTAIKEEQEKGTSLLVSSHSMFETEILCNRVGIMSKGQLVAIGTCAGLRTKFSWGYTAIIKLKGTKRGNESNEENEKQAIGLKQAFMNEFPTAEIKDDRTTMLQYRIITQSLTYGDLFTKMEKLKSLFSTVLEDYAVSETTLEEVFMQLSEEDYKQ